MKRNQYNGIKTFAYNEYINFNQCKTKHLIKILKKCKQQIKKLFLTRDTVFYEKRANFLLPINVIKTLCC